MSGNITTLQAHQQKAQGYVKGDMFVGSTDTGANGVGIGARTLYELRHGGASEDGAAGTLLAEIQKRGRWKTYSSATRYNKSGLLQEARAQLPAHVLAFLVECDRNLWQYVTTGTAPTLPGN